MVLLAHSRYTDLPGWVADGVGVMDFLGTEHGILEGLH